MAGFRFTVLAGMLVTLAASAFATGSLSLSLNSLDPITVGGSTTLTATVSASGDSVSNAQTSITLPTGLSTSDSATQSIGSLSSGQSSSKSWSISGESSGTYTITVSASGDSVTTQTSNATLTVNSPGFISVTEATKPASTLDYRGTTKLQLSFSNTGGTLATVTVNVTPSSGLSITSGNASTSFDVNAGQSTSQSWTFTKNSSVNETISVAITSTANDPPDLSYSVAQTSSGTVTSSGGGDNNQNNTATTNNTNNAAGGITGGTPPTTAQPPSGTPPTAPAGQQEKAPTPQKNAQNGAQQETKNQQGTQQPPTVPPAPGNPWAIAGGVLGVGIAGVIVALVIGAIYYFVLHKKLF